MSKIRIMTDSASDISFEDEKELSISIIPFPVALGDKSYISRVDFDNDQFYELMAQYDGIPATSQITVFQFVEIYKKEAEDGVNDLILVLINSQGSTTYDNSVQAVSVFYEEYPQYKDSFRVHNFDSAGYNAMYGAPVVQAAKMEKSGATVDEIVKYLSEELPKRELFFGIYDLKYAAKSGRIPSAAAFLGTALHLKPVMKIYDHSITTAAKCRGEKKLLEELVKLTLEEMEPGTPYELVYGCDSECLEELREKMEAELGYAATSAYQIGAAVASNSGPKIVGTSFVKKQ